MLWTLALYTMIITVAGDPLPFRAPVVGYAGLVSPFRQSVLIDPSQKLSRMGEALEEVGLNANAVTTSFPTSGVTPSTHPSLPTASAFFQPHRTNMPLITSRTNNGTRKRIRRIRPRLQGFRRKHGSSGLFSSAEMRTAVAQAGGMSRRRPGIMTRQQGTSQWGSQQSILGPRVAQQGQTVVKKEESPKPSAEEYLSRWHKIYNRGKMTTPITTTMQTLSSSESVTTYRPTFLSDLSSTTTVSPFRRQRPIFPKVEHFNPSGLLKAKHPFVPVAHLSKIPSVHDMTSFHFSEAKDVPQMKDNALPTTTTAKPTTTTTTTTTTTPAPTSPVILTSAQTESPFQNDAQEREILESIQSIFQNVDRNGQILATTEVNSPPSFDIFADSEPTNGFKPSFQLTPEIEIQKSYQVSENQAPSNSHESPNFSSWESPETHATFDQAFGKNTGSTGIVSTPLPGDDMGFQVGHSLPVSGHSPIINKQRERNPTDSSIIIGRPAALIQPPPETQRIVDVPAPHYREDSVYTHNPAVPPTQPSLAFAPRPIWRPEEIGPLLKYIESTYDPNMSENSQHSVSNLQSLINTGQAPNMFTNDHLVNYMRDRAKLKIHPNFRVGQPVRQSIERASIGAMEKNSVGTGGAFVALSGIALALVLGAYFIFSGSAIQARGTHDPLKAKIEDAKRGLRLLMKGLDEYEEYLDTDESKIDRKESSIENEESEATEDIPNILNKIWSNLSGTLNHIMEYESPSDGANISVSNEEDEYTQDSETFSRQPHVMSIFPYTENNQIDSSEGKASTVSSLNGSQNSIHGSVMGKKNIFDVLEQLRRAFIVQRKREREMQRTTELNLLTDEPETDVPEQSYDNDNNTETTEEADDTFQPLEDTTVTGRSNEENSDLEYTTGTENLLSQQESTTQEPDSQTVTYQDTTTSPAQKVIINNHLHVYHNPETDPPRSSAFLHNIPFRRLT